MRIQLHKFVLLGLFILIFIGANLYALFYYNGLDSTDGFGIKLAHLIINITISTLFIAYIIVLKKGPFFYAHLIFFFLILFMLINSIWQSYPFEYLPSLLRYFNYWAAFVLGYNLYKSLPISSIDHYLNNFFVIAAITMIFWGIVEIINEDIIFLNGVNRISSGFKMHPLAFSMFSFTLMAFLIIRNRILDKSLFKLLFIIIPLFYLFINSHSRILTVGFVVTFAIVWFQSRKNIIAKTSLIPLFTLIGIGFYLVILNYDISPRLKEVLVSEYHFKDASTNTRIELIKNSIENLSLKDWLFGQGIGGFNNFYYSISGILGIAAHNNFLLFLVEGGILGLFFYVLVQVLFFEKLVFSSHPNRFEVYRKTILLSAVSMYLGIEVFGFLLNNYYFYQTEILVWLFMGLAYSIIHQT